MKPLLAFLVFPLLAGAAAGQERILIDFGVAAELSPSPDIFNRHWNNVSALATTSVPVLVNSTGATASGISLAVTDTFGSTSTNNNGGEVIYAPTATSDFFFVSKGGNATAALRFNGLDATGATVYDLKCFVSSSRSAPEIFLTHYSAIGAGPAQTATLNAIDNIANVGALNGLVAAADGTLTLTVTPDATSTTYGGLGVLELVARPAASAVTPNPQPNNYVTAGSTPNPPAVAGGTNPDGLRVYVYESPDSFTGSVGLGESLRRAGFHVMPLPLNQPPYNAADAPNLDVDFIAFGSFTSESPDYQAYMTQYADDLDDFIDRGGMVFQFAQADQHELRPPFLPDTQDATRSDLDHTVSHILSPAHPLLTGVPRLPGGETLSFTLTDANPFYKNNTQWESFVQFFGFQVILSGDDDARFPGLMEGAYGQGRFFLSALAVDKILNASSGADTTSQSLRDFNLPFFNNLYAYAKAVRDLTTPPLILTPQPGTSLVEDGGWTLVLMPDTQIYAQNYPGLMEAQTSWILNNARPRNIRYVLHLGDIVNVNSVPEWENAKRAMNLLDNKVPYALATGNHDYGPGGNASTRDTFLNDYFKEEDIIDWPTYGGSMVPGKLDNTYHLFEAGGVQWIVISLEWAPRNSTVAWADQIMTAHPGRKGILITHAYMNNNDLRYDITDNVNPQAYNPHLYTTPGPVNDGEELWQKLVKKHNFALTINGHVLGDGTGYRMDLNDAGKPVHQMLVNYQFRNLGGEAYLRTLEFQPDGTTVKVQSYSPLYNNYLLTADQDFSFQLPLGAEDADIDGVLDYFDASYDGDGDGLSNHDEFVLHGSSSSTADTDGDGLTDAAEVAAGTNPLSNDRPVIDAVAENRDSFDLFTPADFRLIRPGDLLLEVENGQVELDFQLEQSGSLQSWSPLGDPIRWTVPADENFRFYHLKIEDPANP